MLSLGTVPWKVFGTDCLGVVWTSCFVVELYLLGTIKLWLLVDCWRGIFRIFFGLDLAVGFTVGGTVTEV